MHFLRNSLKINSHFFCYFWSFLCFSVKIDKKGLFRKERGLNARVYI